MEQVDASTVLCLLMNTPALESLDIISSELIVPLDCTSPVTLPCLKSVHISHLTSAEVHYLMAALDVPALALLDLPTVFMGGATLLALPLLPHALATHRMRRLAFNVDRDFGSVDIALHGPGVSLSMHLHAYDAQKAERVQWALTAFPTTLPLSGVEELHIQASQRDASEDLLLRLAVYMPEVSTLLIRHDPRDDYGDDYENVEGHVALARMVARVLTSDSPVLFPRLAHLELIVSSTTLALCRLLARALAHRDESGRRLRKFCIRLDDEYLFHWKLMWEGKRKPNYKETGIFDHVDVCEVPDEFEDSSGGDEQRLEWGRWRDCVQRTTHEYWRE
uniref:Yersiniabactin-iron ABC transporter permease ATP-binding protein YbtQ n=1 Tax=Ganoderma boninense TaxID=34458 RepID=A0A5K1K7Y4_9APHY|nr:Yersiniabactin-iron ABC transporter permease ATP-binding protein YbtQ [Ganoderma boninense]